MIEKAKITLSDKELELVCNTDWIFTKHAIIEKIYLLFGNASQDMQQTISNSNLPNEIKASTPKISKGENYRLLPYVMLDYPRLFNKENTMAIRTFFWWGNSISMHLLLSGNYKTKFTEKIIANFLLFQKDDLSICVADSQWEHHFEADNYLPFINISEDDFSAILHRNTFLKIGKKISLAQWNQASIFIEETFSVMINLLED